MLNLVKSCVIGIDVGTTGVKVLALSEDGKILGTSNETYLLYSIQPGWNEQNPADWWEGAVSAVRKVLTYCDQYEIAAIGLSGQMHGMVALDADNKVVRNAILWNDQRTESQCQRITEAAGGLEGLLRATNNQMLTGYTGGKIVWLKENEPKNYEKTRLIINPKDYIRYCLSGTLSTDVSDASGFGFYDVKNNSWHEDLISKSGLELSLFPAVAESTAVAGMVSKKAAKLIGLPDGIPIAGGGGDAVISTTGLGLFKTGRIAVTLGTSGVVAMGMPTYMDNPSGKLQFFRGNQPDTFTAMGVTLAAAGSYQWFRQALGQYEVEEERKCGTSAYKLLDRIAAEKPAGSERLIFLPYLMGERSPVNDPAAKGAFIGLTSHHDKGHFIRAVLEGVAYSLRQVYELIIHSNTALKTDEIVLAGGGAVSSLWRQIIADVFNLPVRTVYGSTEGGSFGAALIAGVTAGVWPDLESTVPFIRSESETLPEPVNIDIYNQNYSKYVRMYDALKWSYTD